MKAVEKGSSGGASNDCGSLIISNIHPTILSSLMNASDIGPSGGSGGFGAWFEPTAQSRVSEGTGEKEVRSPDSGGHGGGDARAPSAASVDPVALAFEAARGGRRDTRAPSAASLDPVALAFEAARSGMMREAAAEDGGGGRRAGRAEECGKESGNGIGSSPGADASHPRYPVWRQTKSRHVHIFHTTTVSIRREIRVAIQRSQGAYQHRGTTE